VKRWHGTPAELQQKQKTKDLQSSDKFQQKTKDLLSSESNEGLREIATAAFHAGSRRNRALAKAHWVESWGPTGSALPPKFHERLQYSWSKMKITLNDRSDDIRAAVILENLGLKEDDRVWLATKWQLGNLRKLL
jgi:hypothetical protein